LYHSVRAPYVFDNIQPANAKLTFDLTTIPVTSFGRAARYYKDKANSSRGQVFVKMPEGGGAGFSWIDNDVITVIPIGKAFPVFLFNLYFSKLPGEKEILGEQ
jgi:hypothetical protein